MGMDVKFKHTLTYSDANSMSIPGSAVFLLKKIA